MPSVLFQKRPKMFKQHADNYQYYADRQAMENEIEEIRSKEIGVVNEAFGSSFYPEPKYARVYRMKQAQFNDVVCLYALLDILCVSKRGIYIRPEYLEGILSRQYPQYHWPVGTIGRMMAGLRATCQVEYEEAEDHRLPFDKGRDAKGKYYVIDPMGGDEGLLWLLRCRKVILGKVQDVMAQEAAGDFESGRVGFTQPSVLYYDWFADLRIRNEDGYVAQQRYAGPPRKASSKSLSDDPFAR
jgi:hypothetical protein